MRLRKNAFDKEHTWTALGLICISLGMLLNKTILNKLGAIVVFSASSIWLYRRLCH